MALELQDVVKRTPAFWRTLANKCVGLVKDMTRKGVDYSGSAFPPYSAGYAKLKARGRTGKGKNPGAAKAGAGVRQSSRQISPPDLRFTGDMMRDLQQVAQDKTSVTIGWPTFGDRATYNAEMGRSVIDFDSNNDPHPRMSEAVEAALALDTQEKIDAWAKKKVVYEMRKK